MVERLNRLLINVAERYMYHSRWKNSDNPVLRQLAELMCEVDIDEMWMLTQGGGTKC